MNNIELIQIIRDSFSVKKANIITQFPDWNPIKDARITIFAKCINVCNSTHLAFIYLHFNLTNIQWWKQIANTEIPEDDIKLYASEYDMFTKIGFIQFSFSSVESAFRIFVKEIDPSACNNGTADFKNIYSYLLKKLNLQNYENTLDLLRLIRNTIHNNGVYFHRSGNNESVIHKGIIYDFNIGTPISFVTWNFIFEIIREVEDLIVDVVNSKEIKNIVSINDPYAQ